MLLSCSLSVSVINIEQGLGICHIESKLFYVITEQERFYSASKEDTPSTYTIFLSILYVVTLIVMSHIDNF